MTAHALAGLDARLAALSTRNTASVRVVRRGLSRELKAAPKDVVRALAFGLTSRDAAFDRFLAAELLAAHPPAMQSLTANDVRRLGRGMNSWDDVDIFACIVAGPAWRTHRISDAEVHRWARSADRWWRRAAVVSTVALNNRARGGQGDTVRTLRICRVLLADRDPLIVKAVSWALREVAKHDPRSVREFLAEHHDSVAALVRREVRNKLLTGRKSASRAHRGAASA